MSTPLIVLAAILAFFALVLIPFMMTKSGRSQKQTQTNAPAKQGGNPHKKKKKR